MYIFPLASTATDFMSPVKLEPNEGKKVLNQVIFPFESSLTTQPATELLEMLPTTYKLLEESIVKLNASAVVAVP
jgi:hypothetical protein